MTSRMAKTYRERRAAGKCAGCGDPSPTYYCAAKCQPKRTRLQRERRARRKAERERNRQTDPSA